jgi:hypothetical protein
LSNSALYNVWNSARDRTLNPNNQNFANYGGRGIFMCLSWRQSFVCFLYDMGPRPRGATLERIDNNGPYSPENCEWATRKKQNRNRRDNVLIEYKGELKSVAEWSEQLGVNPFALYHRLQSGWTHEDTIGKPIRKLKPRRKKVATETMDP